jgi:hypothetical protein
VIGKKGMLHQARGYLGCMRYVSRRQAAPSQRELWRGRKASRRLEAETRGTECNAWPPREPISRFRFRSSLVRVGPAKEKRVHQ